MVTPELIDYVKKARAAGQNDDQIKSALLQIGWSEGDADEALGSDPSVVVDYLKPPIINVEEDKVKYAGFWIRLLAALIDGVIMFIPVFFLGLVSSLLGLNESVMKFFAAIIVFGFFIFMIMRYQATLGKMILGLIIVSDNLGRITLAQVLLREIVGKFLSSFLYIGYIMIAFSQRKRGLHDMIAKTLVIHKD
jgi:uncharacterized RDD family membrane protein YckC